MTIIVIICACAVCAGLGFYAGREHGAFRASYRAAESVRRWRNATADELGPLKALSPEGQSGNDFRRSLNQAVRNYDLAMGEFLKCPWWKRKIDF